MIIRSEDTQVFSYFVVELKGSSSRVIRSLFRGLDLFSSKVRGEVMKYNTTIYLLLVKMYPVLDREECHLLLVVFIMRNYRPNNLLIKKGLLF